MVTKPTPPRCQIIAGFFDHRGTVQRTMNVFTELLHTECFFFIHFQQWILFINSSLYVNKCPQIKHSGIEITILLTPLDIFQYIKFLSVMYQQNTPNFTDIQRIFRRSNAIGWSVDVRSKKNHSLVFTRIVQM